MERIEINGSFGEGGGQVLRTALGLSVATGKAVRIRNIRAKRPRPGLSHQHFHAVKALQLLSSASVTGLELGSKELVFKPAGVAGGSFEIDIGTAGSISLVFHAFLLGALGSRARAELVVKGGTDVPFSPPMDYVRNLLLGLLSKMGAEARVEVRRRGHYPEGGGLAVLSTAPSRLKGIVLEERGELLRISGVSHCTSLPRHVAERQRDAALQHLRSRLGVEGEVECEVSQGGGKGSGIVLWAEYENTLLGSTALGKPGKRAEEVGREAANKLVEEIGSEATVDVHMGDQLMPYLALAEEPSIYICRLTGHGRSNLYVIERMLGMSLAARRLGSGLVMLRSLPRG